MVARAQGVLEHVQFDSVDSTERFTVAAATGAEEELGVYGEMSFEGMAEVLLHPAVSARLLGGTANFVDFGSGCGRLLLGVAAMCECESVVGLEALKPLHAIADKFIAAAESTESIGQRTVRSIHARAALPHDDPDPDIANALGQCDVLFMYSTAFPSEDELRLPELSASLSLYLREGSLVVTTDKFLVGSRYVFEALLPVVGESGERIHAIIWRVAGALEQSYESALEALHAEGRMGEDACEHNAAACEALLTSLEADGLDTEQ